MMEYFTYKKIKKHQAEKRAKDGEQTPVISEEDEHFLTRVISAEGTPPPLPERPQFGPEAGDSTNNQAQMVVHDGNGPAEGNGTTEPALDKQATKDKGKGKESEKHTEKDGKKTSSRFSFLARTLTKKHKDKENLSPKPVVTPDEATKEEDDITRILNDLNLAAVNNRAFSLSKESQELVQKFTVILKDLVNGVPTAYDDLVHLLDDSQGTLAKSYDHLPSFLQKLITQLPTKLTGSLAPELLAVATEAQAFGAASAGASGGFSAAAKSFLKPTSLKDLVTKPGAVVGLLKTIMNALKLRWPAFMGTNVLLSLGLFVLLFVFWYCHKRGRETRLEREAKVDSEGRIIELDDDPMLDGPSRRPNSSRRSTERERRPASSREHTERRPTSSRNKSSDKKRKSSDRVRDERG
ncbi:hypothetical protein L207DRAFT_507449 [Hyaloscypha variabilis F]|uniref:Ring-like domain-containing protein n=1 Tax=Hyaloscypha variabilis (strain UAMH 11265 / GT02V1 / F) TaxID=1149755 RepID=A0A2J6S715_HYAVF|nr:hypothetical protein L207DRAFT_507449 [Hyaloscypha variabilis F]